MNTQVGSVLIDESDKIGIVYGDKFEALTGNAWWTVRTVHQPQIPVIKRTLQTGASVQWKDTGVVVNPEWHGIEAFNLIEIKSFVSGRKLSYPMTKQDFVIWVDRMYLLAKDQHKFGQYDVGRSTAKCLLGTIQKAFFYFEITEEEDKLFEEIKSELWGLGYL